MAEPKCARCGQKLRPDHSVTTEGHAIVHLDCRRPREPTPEERAILYVYCWTHVVAKCVACGHGFRQQELAADPMNNRDHLCPRCHADLSESMRGHLYGCAMLPAEVRRRAQAARDAAIRLVKQTHQLTERADVLIAEAEAAISALRETMRRIARPAS